MAQPSLARDFFDRITETPDPIAAIRALIASDAPTTESDFIDFKGEYIRLPPQDRDKAIKVHWSKALGGFSNNEGGVVVWGLGARKHDRGDGVVDAVRTESPMRLPVALASRLT